ncbi:MAG: D-alanyl-D-alanine carboxypeptidase, partial [Burkholderiales bacterium]|nr:D-alanyl-D-alanine carboxypeptidase [Burkholderiales bacterium]
AASPYAQLLRASLPEVGVDGTMKARFVGEPLAGHAWIKTGSLDDVRSIAGYVQAGSGRWYAVAMIVNGPGAAASRALQDTFLRWVHANG